jgi:Golgi-body localisation protein domain
MPIDDTLNQDLLQINVPHFSVSATDRHFAAISDIVDKLLLFSDAAHKTRLNRVETLLFSYDFTDFASSAKVVSDLQSRLRDAVEQEQAAQFRLRRCGSSEDKVRLEMAKIRADVLALSDELSYVFEAIKLAQDKVEWNSDQKSALLLVAFSQEVSWKMLDARRDLLAKLSVMNVKFSWLSRQDSSIVNRLKVGDLHAFDGSADAIWAEVLCKHNEPSNHPLVKVCAACPRLSSY